MSDGILNGLDPATLAEHFGEVDLEYTWLQEPQTMTHSDEVKQLRARVAELERERNAQNLTFATLCDMLGLETDRSDDALVRAVGELKRERDFQHQQVKDLSATAEYYRALVQEARDERDAANRQLEFFRNQFPTAARNWDRVNGASDSGDGVGDEGWQYYISSQ